jgi:hypothetical protein
MCRWGDSSGFAEGRQWQEAGEVANEKNQGSCADLERNYLVVEFDTNTTYKTGASLAFRIDPASGALTLVPGDFPRLQWKLLHAVCRGGI